MILKDTANWSGIELVSQNICANTKKVQTFVSHGYRYVTRGEWMIAEILAERCIPFTPDVGALIHIPKEERIGKEKDTKTYVPDFVFNKQAYLWYNHGNSVELIHGIEAKGAQDGIFSKKAHKYVRLLREQLGIHIKLLSEPEIKSFYARRRLPIKPFKPST